MPLTPFGSSQPRYLQGDLVHGADPRDHGFLAMTYDPFLINATATLTTGQQYIVKVWWPRTALVTNITFSVGTAASGLTAGANNLAVYDSTGTQLCATADQTTNYTSTGVKTVAFTTPTTITGGAGVFLWLAVKSSGTTPVALHRSTAPAGTATVNIGLSAAQYRVATIGVATTGLLPASFTPASNTAGTSSPWMALS